MSKLKKVQNKAMNSQTHSQTSDNVAESFSEQFRTADLVWIFVGILALIALGYAVIHFDIVSVESFTIAMSKYNVSQVTAGLGQ